MPRGAKAFVPETETGRELDEGLPARAEKGRGRLSRPAAVGYDYKRIHRFWRNYHAPRRKAERRKAPQEYIDAD